MNRQQIFSILFFAGIFAVSFGFFRVMNNSKKERQTDLTSALSVELKNIDSKTVTVGSMPRSYKLVYFGFTRCPSICPRTLSDVSEAIDLLKKNGKSIQVIFISIDPERDTPEVMKKYLQSFHREIIGLTGSPANIDLIRNVFGIVAKKIPVPGKSGDYSVDHNMLLYLLTP
ncbi:MAG: SCO family protein, partial [Leptospira sp.]|nr:SCO family protein [Leptospira sp.]